MRRPLLLSALLLSASGYALQAQQEHDHGPAQPIAGGGVFPAGWSVQLDEGGKPADVALQAMAPGWHVTTAASGIMYRGQDVASGSYQVSAKLHLFPEGPGHREAFGIFLGGKDLSGPAQRYTYFLIRGDGTFKIKRRSGASASDLSGDWKLHPAIFKSDGKGPVANLLGIVVTKDRVSFQVNGQEVYSAAADAVDVEGIAGLRVNHNLSIHVENLEIRKS